MGQLWIKKEVQFPFGSSNIGASCLLRHSGSHEVMINAVEQTQKWPHCAVNANWMAAQSCGKQRFVLCTEYALLDWDVKVKQTSKAMKEMAVMLLQPFSDNTCLETWCIIMLYVQVWIHCNHGGINVCQENIVYPIGSGSPSGKIRVSERELHNSRTSYRPVFFSTLQGTLPLCKIAEMKQIT